MLLKIILAIVLLVAIGWLFFGKSKKKAVIRAGIKAPLFSCLNEQNKKISLSDFLGKKVVLYFYPKDDTPGCTKQACGLRDNYAVYDQHSIVVLGISYDSPESHKMFKEKYNLPFSLLSDEQHVVARLYGADQNALGNYIPQRKTILIDEKGSIVAVIENVDVHTHAQEVLQLFGTSANT